ncbi:MAG: hypothetical protein AB7U63_11530 [Porticoccaceae bacterium]
MKSRTNDEVLIEIDDQIEVLINEINSAPNREQQQDFAKACREVIVDTLMGPFGLSAAMFTDHDGGNITTVHNFENGTYAPRDAERYQNYQNAQTERFDRSDYERDLPKERKEIFKQKERIEDEYTGRELPKDGRAHRDHVVSAHEIEKSSRGHLGQTREERVATANREENKVWTDSSLNQSKNDHDLREWSERPNRQDPSKTNAEYYEADPKRMEEAYRTARKKVDSEQNKAVLIKQAGEFVYEGSKEAGNLALRQILGLLIKDLAEGLIDDIRTLIREGFQSLQQLAALLKNRITATIKRIKAKWAEYLKEGVAAGFSGFLSSFLTLIINSFVTTAKNIVRIIREGCLSVVRALKIIVSPPPGTSVSEVAYEVFKILSGAVVVAIGIGLEETIKKGIEAVPLLAPFAGPISLTLTGMLTGILSLTVVLAFDRLKNHLVFRNKQLADIHRGQSMVLLKIKKTALVLDQASEFVQVSATHLRVEFQKDWDEIKELKSRTEDKIESYKLAIHRLQDLSGEL